MKQIFYGDPSNNMWKKINGLSAVRGRKKLARATARALYVLGCKCQELEDEVARLKKIVDTCTVSSRR